MRQVHITTFGCQMNEKDSQTIARIMASYDYQVTEKVEQADLILVNTCSIRQKAEEKTYSLLGRLKQLKNSNPGLIIGVGGCVAQQEGKRLLERVPHLDLVFGTRLIHQLPDLIEKVRRERSRLSRTEMDPGEPYLNPLPAVPGFFQGVKASVTIMQGCNNYCAYCVVPLVRGPEESRPSQDILSEVKTLAANGVRETLLLGQNVNSFGQNRMGEISFALLLHRLKKIPGLERIRFTTSHPKDLSAELINCFGRIANLCEHIHLPVQSGSNRILRKMNRYYTRETYLEKIVQLREGCPGLAITSDVIVGFPGETDADFEETMDLIRTVQYDDLFSFKYSNRPKTPASNFPDPVPEEEKSRRLNELQAYQKKVTLSKHQAMEGTVQQVLVEGTSKKTTQDWMGRTRTNKIVNFPGPSDLLGKTVPVRIEKAYVHSLKGSLE
ncbi:MAG: tRNA (N6-isopentenyl adenosine(37)-C2)-methylthiotransferase MiaB [Deltaproteobacteria bacterium RBG_13_43_22]|nr:MAG: tRNA (N6-isopentenyl adenosine(37)-C2)-methylthiotransferase MiaB [Deltaproteobacteria bacterium RBG_13_43_22]